MVNVVDKQCRDCGITKSADQFTEHKATRDRLQPYCRACRLVRSRRDKARMRDRRRESGDTSKRADSKRCIDCGQIKSADEFGFAHDTRDRMLSYCKPCHNLRKVAWRAEKPDKVKQHNREGSLRKYGLTPESFAELLEVQGGRCAICGGTQAKSRWPDEPLHVDHDHTTGVVRGLLCNQCNHGLGKFRDNPHWLRAAARYLEVSR